MTAQKDLKSIIRDRQSKTGESYTAARAHVMRARAELLGLPEEAEAAREKPRLEAIILKVNERSVRARLLADGAQVTFRASEAYSVVPGQLVTLVVNKRWTYRGDDYASGRIVDARIDAAKLGLVPLPLTGGALVNLRDGTEPYRRPDPHAPLWRKLTARPRPCYEFDGIAWGAFPGEEYDDNATCNAAELVEEGHPDRAEAMLKAVLLRDLRCLDAHAHLGNLAFERSPQHAMLHYEVGIRIGELSFPPGFNGVVEWGPIYNRPFLRCLHGYALCLWKLGKLAEARWVFERNLALSPHDRQGVRFCLQDVLAGRTWEEATGKEAADEAEPTNLAL